MPSTRSGMARRRLRYALASDYDVVVLDLMLPGRDGLSVLAELRKRGRRRTSWS